MQNKNITNNTNGVDGLYFMKNFIDDELHTELLEYLDNNNPMWTSVGNEKSRKVIQFGYKYDYSSKDIYKKTIPMSPLIKKVRDKLSEFFTDYEKFNQCIVNKYLPGEGISKHIDRFEFGNTICCITIGSGANMYFSRGEYEVPVYTYPKSIYIMTNDARYKWKHEMKSTKNDIINGKNIERGIRIFITFREVKELK